MLCVPGEVTTSHEGRAILFHELLKFPWMNYSLSVSVIPEQATVTWHLFKITQRGPEQSSVGRVLALSSGIPGFGPQHHMTLSMVIEISDPSTGEAEIGGSQNQGHPWLYSQCVVFLGCDVHIILVHVQYEVHLQFIRESQVSHRH